MMQALLMIDVQKGFSDTYWGKRNNPEAEDNMSLLLEAFRKTDRKIFHVQHMSTEKSSPLRPHQVGNDFMDFARPIQGEKIFQKRVNSAFIGTSLEETLKQEGVGELLVVGLTTDHCVSTSVRMGANLGFKIGLASDATATFNRVGFDGQKFEAALVHSLALASLQGEFASVRQTHSFIKELGRY